jgi:hypothetical protein
MHPVPSAPFSLFSLLALFATSASATLTTTGSTVTLDGTAYYVPPTSVGTVQLNGRPIWPGWGFGGGAKLGAGLLPMTVVTGPTGFDAMGAAKGFGAVDDVWANGFMEGMSCCDVMGMKCAIRDVLLVIAASLRSLAVLEHEG